LVADKDERLAGRDELIELSRNEDTELERRLGMNSLLDPGEGAATRGICPWNRATSFSTCR
jgi:hypothetical protein